MYGYGFRPNNKMFGGSAINPIWDGLLAYYTADNTPNDALGTYNGTLTNGTTYGTGIINQGFSLDGVNDYVDLPVNMFKPTGDFTINFWVKQTGSNGRFIQFASESPYNGVILYSYSGNSFRVLIGNNGTFETFSAGIISSTVMTMVTFVRDSVSNMNYIYINGELSQSFASSLNPTYPATTIGRIGCSSIGTAFTAGIIDEVALFDTTAKNSTEVTELYNAGAGKQYPN